MTQLLRNGCPRLGVVRLLVLILVVSGSGCGTADYEAKFNDSLSKFRLETPFIELFSEPTHFPETPLSLRLPSYLGEKTAALDHKTADPRDPKKPLDANRVEPDFLQLPGHVRTYECFVDVPRDMGVGTLSRPVYCYVAVASDRKESAEDLEAKLRDQLFATFGALREETLPKGSRKVPQSRGVGDWADITVPTPEGTNMTVRKLVAVGDQTFQYYDAKDGTVKIKILPGKYVVYLYNTPGTNVLIAWRALLGTAEHVQMEAKADTCVGTIVIGAEG